MFQVTTVDMTWVFFHGLGKVWKREGLKVTSISAPGPGLERMSQEERVHTVALPFSREINIFQDLQVFSRLLLLLLRDKPEIVHAHTPKAGVMAMFAGMLAGVPLRFFHLHGLAYSATTGWRRLLLKFCDRLACTCAHQVFPVSHYVSKQASIDSLCPERKLHVLENGTMNGIDSDHRFNPSLVPVHKIRELKKKLGIPNGVFVIGFVGRLTKEKGVEDLLAALKNLDATSSDWEAVFVGPLESRQPISNNLLVWATKHSRIHFTKDFVRDIESWYSIMDVVILPTYREGFPTVPLEAGAMEKPVIASSIPPCAEAVLDGETGKLFPVGDVRSLTKAILEYLHHPKLGKIHGERGRERIKRLFSPHILQQALMQEYKTWLKRRGEIIRDS